MITAELIDSIVAGSKSVAEVLSGVSSELVAEALNLYLLTSVLNILKFSGIFLLFFILKKYLGYLKESNLITEAINKGLSLFIIVSSMMYFFTSSYPPKLENQESDLSLGTKAKNIEE